jgi:tetratricopeptide (TPR) repeat protein/predicted aspartyl protease
MSGRSLAVALIVAALSATGAAAAPAGCHLRKVAELPVSMVGPRAQVTFKINGEPTRFMADSGAFYSFINEAAAQRLKLATTMAPPGFAVRGFGGSDSRVYIATVRDFGIADAVIHNVQFLVLRGLDESTAGAIGQNILSVFDTEYDLGNGLIRLMKPDGGCGHTNLAYWSAGKDIGLMDIGRIDPQEPHIRGEAKVNGQTIRVMFDSGSPTSMLKRSAAERLGFSPSGEGVRAAGLARGIGPRVFESWIAPFKSVDIGGEQIQNTQLRVADFLSDKADMILGMDFFLSHRIYVSHSQHQLYFTYNGGPVFRLDRLTPAQLQASAEPAPAASPAAQPTATAAGAPAAPAYADAPTDAEGFARRGQASMSRRNFAAALADFSRAAELEPKEPMHFRNRAEAHLALRQPVLAMADFDEALKLKPDDVASLMGRGVIYLGSMAYDRAAADFAAAIKVEPDLAPRVGEVYTAAGQFERALAAYDGWIAANPRNDRLPTALNGRCWTRALWNHELDKALADCEAALKRGPRAAGVLDSRGLVHLRRGEFDLAIADYDAAIRLQPKEAWSLYGRGLAKLAKGAKSDGEADLAAATALAPNLPAAAKRYGLVAAAAGGAPTAAKAQ